VKKAVRYDKVDLIDCQGKVLITIYNILPKREIISKYGNKSWRKIQSWQSYWLGKLLQRKVR